MDALVRTHRWTAVLLLLIGTALLAALPAHHLGLTRGWTTEVSVLLGATGAGGLFGLAWLAWLGSREPSITDHTALALAVGVGGVAWVRHTLWALGGEFAVMVSPALVVETVFFSLWAAVVGLAYAGRTTTIAELHRNTLQAVRRLPALLHLWLVFLATSVMVVPLLFVAEHWARAFLLCQVINMATAYPLVARFGLSRILGLCHLVAWPVAWGLWVSAAWSAPLDGWGALRGFGAACVGVSLVIDGVDVVRFARGEREPM